MKQKFIHILTVMLIVCLWHTADAQTVTTNPESWNTLIPSGTCTGCTITIPAGDNLLLNSTGTCDGCTFNGGGTVTVSAAFKFPNNTTTFNNLTVIFNTTPGSVKNLNFSNDSIAVNTNITYSSGPTEISNSRISINATLKFQTANFSGDSIHLNNTLSFSGNTDTISNSHVDMANGSTLSTQIALFTGSVFSLTGSAALSTNTLTSSSNDYYMDGSSTFKISSSASMTNDFLSLSGSAGFSNSSGLTFSGGSITTNNNSTFKASSSMVATNASLSFNDNSAVSVSSALAVTGGSMVMNGSATFKASSNATFQATTVNLNGGTSLTVSSNLILKSGTDLTIGDGSGSAQVSASGLSVLNNSLVGVRTGNSIKVSSGSFTNDAGSVSLSPSTVSGCATLNNAGNKTCVVLAVSDINLSATDAGSGRIALSWSDNETTAADHYLVQRNPGNNNAWTTIATIAAGGYSNGDYRFTDDDAPAGTIDYRIVRIDGDGKTLYSPISSITVSSVGTGANVSIHPNPAIGGTFYINTPYLGQMIVNVYTMTGQLLLRSELNGQTQYAVRLPSQTPISGAVVVQTIAQGTTRSFTVLVR